MIRNVVWAVRYMRSPRTPLAVIAILGLFQFSAGCTTREKIMEPKDGPTADFSAAPRSGETPLKVAFTDRSISGTSEITSVLWNFGDNTRSSLPNTTHLYLSPGTYTVSLTVTTADGINTAAKTDYVTVTSAP